MPGKSFSASSMELYLRNRKPCSVHGMGTSAPLLEIVYAALKGTPEIGDLGYSLVREKHKARVITASICKAKAAVDGGKSLFRALMETLGDVGYGIGHIRDCDRGISTLSAGSLIDGDASGRYTNGKPLSVVCGDGK